MGIFSKTDEQKEQKMARRTLDLINQLGKNGKRAFREELELDRTEYMELLAELERIGKGKLDRCSFGTVEGIKIVAENIDCQRLDD